MSEGLFGENDDVEDGDSDGNEAEGVLVTPVRAINRKTKQERTKQKEQKEEVSRRTLLSVFLAKQGRNSQPRTQAIPSPPDERAWVRG